MELYYRKVVVSSPAVADINNDSLLEVIIGSYDNKVYALNYDGSLLWSYTTGDVGILFTSSCRYK